MVYGLILIVRMVTFLKNLNQITFSFSVSPVTSFYQRCFFSVPCSGGVSCGWTEYSLSSQFSVWEGLGKAPIVTGCSADGFQEQETWRSLAQRKVWFLN